VRYRAEQSGRDEETVESVVKLIVHRILADPWDDRLLVHLRQAVKFCRNERIKASATEAEAAAAAGNAQLRQALELQVVK